MTTEVALLFTWSQLQQMNVSDTFNDFQVMNIKNFLLLRQQKVIRRL